MEYKERIIETLVALSEARELTFMQLLNIAMENELKDIDNAFTVGDKFVFELSHFEGLTDTNVVKLVELCKNIESTYFDMMDLNGIDDADITQYQKN